MYCCDTTALSNTDQFELSASSYTFGVRVTESRIQPLAFKDSFTEFRVEQFQTTKSRNSYTLREGDRMVDKSLLLLRFIIGMVPQASMMNYKACTLIFSNAYGHAFLDAENTEMVENNN